MLFGTSCIPTMTTPVHTHRTPACKFEQMRSYHYSLFSLLGSLKATARDSSRELHSAVAQILTFTGLLTQASPCAKLHNNRPSVSEWNASNRQDLLCAALNENTTSEDPDCAIYKRRENACGKSRWVALSTDGKVHLRPAEVSANIVWKTLWSVFAYCAQSLREAGWPAFHCVSV